MQTSVFDGAEFEFRIIDEETDLEKDDRQKPLAIYTQNIFKQISIFSLLLVKIFPSAI